MSHKKNEDNYSGCGCLGCIGVLFLVMLLIGGCTALFDDSNKDTENNKTEQKSNKQVAKDKKEDTDHKKVSNSKADNKKSEENNEDKSKDNDDKHKSQDDKDKSQDDKDKSHKPGTTDRIPVELVSTVDGDTAKFKYDGKTETFRFLLIDTPETKHPRLGKQPYGQEASDRTEALLNFAANIEVEFDVGQKKDKYGRYLAYVYVDDEMLNNILVREGLAKVGYVYPPNTRYLSELEDSQDKAKSEQIGIWSIGSAFEEDNTQEESTPSNEPAASSEPTTDSNAATPEPAPSSSVESFPNCTALREVYPNGVPQGHPAYSSKHDRDGDAYACEVN